MRIIFIFSTLLFATLLFESATVHAQEAQEKAVQQVLGPALVTPPDALTDELSPAESTEYNTNQENSSTIDNDTENTTNSETNSELTLDEEPVQTTYREPLPQIKRKKDYIDQRFRPETRYIEHPNASKGLIKIDKDKVYYYKTSTSEQNKAGSFRLGTYEPTELVNPDNATLTYTSLYGDTAPILLLYDQEWQFFQSFGKLAWKLGGGLYLANGNGQFETPNPDTTAIPPEKFTLFIFPLNVGAIYRMQYFKNQWVVPYVEGGLDAFCFGETRDDDQNPTIGAALGIAPAAHFSLGGSLALGKDARSFLDLDREYGINAIYLTLEYRNYVSLSERFDFSGEAITGGFTAEY